MSDRIHGSAPPSRAWPWVWWVAALVVVPSLLAASALLWPGPQLADDLRARADAALDGAGLGAAAVTIDGRDANVSGVPGGAEGVAAAAVAGVAGIGAVRVAAGSGPGTSPATGGQANGDPAAERRQLVDGLAAVLGSVPITFAADSAVLEGPPAATVARVTELLRAAPGSPVRLEGHVADTPGSPETAQQLSERRAAVVAEALVAGGVERSRVTTRGRAAEVPLATPAASRRVEIVIG